MQEDISAEYRPEEYDPAALVGSLCLGSLIKLQDTLEGDWAEQVQQQRVVLEQEAKRLLRYTPLGFEAQEARSIGSYVYLRKVRKANNALPMLRDVDFGDLMHESKLVERYAEDIIGASDFSTPETNRGELISFYAHNLKYLLLTARAHALNDFKAQKLAVLRQIPGADPRSLEGMKLSIRWLDEPLPHLAAARTAIFAHTLFKLPCVDFFQLDDGCQTQIRQAAWAEFTEICEVMQQYAPELMGVAKNRAKAPLAYVSVSALKAAIAQNPGVPPQEICTLYLQFPAKFSSRLAELASHHEERQKRQRELRRFVSEQPATPDMTGQPVALDAVSASNRDAMRGIVAHGEVNAALADLQPGQMMCITDQDVVIPPTRFSVVFEKNLAFLVRTLYERYPRKGPIGSKLFKWQGQDLGEKARAGFRGRISNLAVTWEEPDEAGVKLRPAEEFLGRLLFSMEIKSSGRPSQIAEIAMIVCVTPSEEVSDRLKVRLDKHKTLSDPALVVNRLQLIAQLEATRAESAGMQHPSSAGLPTLGTRP